MLTHTIARSQGEKIDSLLHQLSEVDTDTLRIDILNELAFAYIHVNPEIAKDDVNIAHEAARELNYKRGMALSQNAMGGIAWGIGNYEKALEHFMQSLKLYEEMGDELSSAMMINNIGEIYKKLEDTDRALTYLLEALNLLEKYGRPMLGYVNVGEIYLMTNDYDSAIHYFNRAIERNNIEKNKKYEAYAYHGIAEAELSRNHLEAAMENADKALKLRKENRDMRGHSNTALLKARIYGILGNMDSVRSYMDESLAIARNINARDIEMHIFQSKAQFFEENEEFDSAYFNYIQYSKVKDNLFSEEKANQIARLQTAFDTELLKKENETSNTKLRQRNIVIVGVVMLVIFAVAVAIAFYIQRRGQQNINNQLARKNDQIKAQSEEIQAQADKLAKLNENLENLNLTLENKIKVRTQILKDQNRILAEYAHSNAHELRAPVASVMGLVQLLENSRLNDEEKEIISHLSKSVNELDAAISRTRRKLENNSDLYSNDYKPLY